nr:hypothetical protein P5668_13935 [Bacillus subtilis]
MVLFKKGFAILAASFLAIGTFAACSSSKNPASADGKKVLTVSVEETYKEYIESIKTKFEKENDVTVKIVEKQMFEQLEALPLDGTRRVMRLMLCLLHMTGSAVWDSKDICLTLSHLIQKALVIKKCSR